jgi:hypothetical protein
MDRPGALRAFSQVLTAHKLDLSAPASSLPEDGIAWFADALKAYAPATERLYLSAVVRFSTRSLDALPCK